MDKTDEERVQWRNTCILYKINFLEDQMQKLLHSQIAYLFHSSIPRIGCLFANTEKRQFSHKEFRYFQKAPCLQGHFFFRLVEILLIDIVTWNSKNFGTLKPNANIVTSKMYIAGWHLLILIHSGLQTAK